MLETSHELSYELYRSDDSDNGIYTENEIVFLAKRIDGLVGTPRAEKKSENGDDVEYDGS